LIRKQKKPLFNSVVLLVAAFVVYLSLFLFYSFKFNPDFLKITSITYFIFACFFIGIWKQYQKNRGILLLDKENVQEQINLFSDRAHKDDLRIESLGKSISRYSSLKGLTENLGKNFDLEDTIKILIKEIYRLIQKKDNTYILYLVEKKTKQLSIEATKRPSVKYGIQTKQGDIFDSWVLSKMQPLLVEDVKNDFRFDFEKISNENPRKMRSIISAPLIIGKRIIGIIRIDNGKDHEFSSEDLRLLSTIADLGAIAIENAQLFRRTKELAIKDGLTGLFLRRYFFDRLNIEFQRAVSSESEISLLMIDIDNFKTYNDKFGHIAGDILLRHISKTLLSVFSQAGNIVCRYGGEEFAVLLPNVSKKSALQLAEQAREKVKETQILLRNKYIPIAVSIGVASFPKDLRQKEELVQKADSALYKAKQKGKDRVCSC